MNNAPAAPDLGSRPGRDFYARPTLQVARELLGKLLVRSVEGRRVSGIVVETEAYVGRSDTACHAHRGKTPRNAVMFGPPGVAYVYFVYGMHHCLNAVTEPEGEPCAVLIRAIVPREGLDFVRENRRGRPDSEFANGPAKLCRALAIDAALNGADLVNGGALWFEECLCLPEGSVIASPRIGINYADEKDRLAPWRFMAVGLPPGAP